MDEAGEIRGEAEKLFKLIWDYFGPDAEPTALHFHHHLTDFFKRHESLAEQLVSHGVSPVTTGQSAAWCVLPEGAARQVAAALRPRRGGPVDSASLHSEKSSSAPTLGQEHPKTKSMPPDE